MNRFEGRRVLVTGAGSGIGRATVLRLLDEGAAVVAADVSDTGLEETSTLGGRADRLHTQLIDVSDESAVCKGVAAAVSALGGGLDVLVNAAGILRSARTEKMSLDFWNSVLAVNLTGTFLTTREALPALLASDGGVVVNFSSTSASFAHPYMAAYAATKGGIQSFTHAIASEYARRGLRAVCVAPGSIASGMTTNPGLPADADMSLFVKLAPALTEGFADPSAVAGVVAMLASDDGAFITGTELRIDGGTHM
ncbi:SDR family NAD(P)-dependent oxidoreductase [Streptomyces sp. NPDC058534]|uniref:SDR family NAD(P)-dependent oxidoreductase n=1 Tax=Streptomyces sp. NPDC058534 TaxID=3346541 RepID=UPI003663CE78